MTPDEHLRTLRRWVGALERFAVIAPALLHPPYSRERAAAIRELIRQGVSSQARVYTWLKSYEQNGMEGLLPTNPGGGGRRVRLSPQWDSACPLPRQWQQSTAQAVASRVAELRRLGVRWDDVQAQIEQGLAAACRQAGWDDPDVETHCRLSIRQLRNLNRFHGGDQPSNPVTGASAPGPATEE